MARSHFQRHLPSHTVANDDYRRQTQGFAKPVNVLRELGQRVVPFWCVALPMPAQVDSDHSMEATQVFQLRLQERVIACPSMHKDDRTVSRSLFPICQCGAVAHEVLHGFRGAIIYAHFHFRSAEGEGKGFGAGIEKLDLEVSIRYRHRLPD